MLIAARTVRAVVEALALGRRLAALSPLLVAPLHELLRSYRCVDLAEEGYARGRENHRRMVFQGPSVSIGLMEQLALDTAP